ncbi:MAG: TraB/GumN family protein [Glaciecola sp.]
MRLLLIKKAILSAVILIVTSTSAFSAPVFKVTKNNSTIYIGGTFHILTPNDFPLQEAFYKAYEQSDTLYFETDIEATKSPAFQAKLMPVMLAQNGSTLATLLSGDTMNALKAYSEAKGLPLAQLMPLSPTGLMLTITVMEYQARGFTLAGVDDHMFKKGVADNKQIKWFETIEQQVAFLDSFDNGDPDQLINYVLESTAELDEMVDKLHSSWRSGDMQTLASINASEFADYPEVYTTLIKDRNDAWMKTIRPMFNNDSVEFVLVGALHLPGKDGLLTQLKAQGYDVTQVP